MIREQDQFLNVTDRDLAKSLWDQAARSHRLSTEAVDLSAALERVLAEDILAPIDVPGFDRSNFDGYAVRAEDTFDAAEETAICLTLNAEELATGVVPRIVVCKHTATPISTGGMLPRGADAVAMIEITTLREGRVLVKKPIAPGSGVTFAGTDMARGELIMWAGTLLTSRETGVIAALGLGCVNVVRRPRVAILSTGDEIVAPGLALPLGSVYDSNAMILADSVRELGGEVIVCGIIRDDEEELSRALDRAVQIADLVVLSGGTSKGAGDVSYRVLAARSPGIAVHGVALKPGKPVCLGAVGKIPVAILPGFPTSAVFTFHEFVAPRIRTMAGRRTDDRETIAATMATRVNSDRGRTEYVLVSLIEGENGLSAYPMGKGSGSVTAFAKADGFVTIAKHQEYVDEGEAVGVTKISRGHLPAQLIVIGSQCAGLDYLLGILETRGITTKTLWVGSQGGLLAASRGECDIAGVHLLDEETGVYNRTFLPAGVKLSPGYGRMQGMIFRPDDGRFATLGQLTKSFDDPSIAMVNRNRGSGTRVLIDGLLQGKKPPGFAIEARSHNASCAAVAQERADWGVAIEPMAKTYGLGFVPLREEQYDFAIPASRWDRPAVAAFRRLLIDPLVCAGLIDRGFAPSVTT